MESIINRPLLGYLEEQLADHQYGFGGGRSASHLVTLLTHRCAETIENDTEALIASLDTVKAVHRAWHKALKRAFQEARKFQVTRARRTASADWWITPGTAGMRPRDLFTTSRDYRESVGVIKNCCSRLMGKQTDGNTFSSSRLKGNQPRLMYYHLLNTRYSYNDTVIELFGGPTCATLRFIS
ncbi:hypothetical protein EVAR_87793_1 [Eumeta japonica]|uniref:Uncharacterized protein n=1 Tax=Eumeta variegata TaxID=151549 RepID=A0A4C1X7J2_EUMVA|nr:hypothetical protein EVAR_87793_1 [Eumeta japonica]